MQRLSPPLAAFVEEVALFLEPGGMPRIAGRIVGYLLVCDPPHRSAAQLAEELSVSRGSVSTMVRMLRTTGLLEPAPVPGERAIHLRLSDDGFEAVFEHQIRQVSAFGELASKGLTVLRGAPSERTRRLRLLAALYGFYEREMPGLLERWRTERARIIRDFAAEGSE
ncbi:MAG: MarR family transcriptional regulator [Gemmatimonadota bacterium]